MNPEPRAEEEPVTVPISALEHFSYCARQCALIHVEQTFDENLFTVRGNLAHQRVDSAPASTARGVRVLRAVPLWSDRYGLSGRADVVELHRHGPVPVEYKVGRIAGGHAEIQLCAQAICLEEMFSARVSEGVLYSHATKKRRVVPIDDPLRQRTLRILDATRKLIAEQLMPGAPNDARCPNCSLVDACLPSVMAGVGHIQRHQVALFTPLGEDEGSDWFE